MNRTEDMRLLAKLVHRGMLGADDAKAALAAGDGAIPIYAARRVPAAEPAPPPPQPVQAPQGLPAEYTQSCNFRASSGS